MRRPSSVARSGLRSTTTTVSAPGAAAAGGTNGARATSAETTASEITRAAGWRRHRSRGARVTWASIAGHTTSRKTRGKSASGRPRSPASGHAASSSPEDDEVLVLEEGRLLEHPQLRGGRVAQELLARDAVLER